MDINVICDGTNEKETITIEFSKDKNYDLNYESDLIKHIKSKNILNENDIKYVDGYIVTSTNRCTIDTPWYRDYIYKDLYTDKKDKMVKDKLVDKQSIDIYDDEKKCIWYEDYKQGKYGESIIFEMSYIDVLYTYPNCMEYIMFRIVADDKVKGFTKHELIMKLYERYHLIYSLSKHWDMKEGIYDGNIDNCNNCNKGNFKCVFDYQYYNNGIHHLEYNLKKELWVTEMLDYL